ncbi:nucleotidyltransferase domain-containing protein [Pantoea allii]|uniref:nucleotidyltransferase domain-containing protein n=1 Tax=Pantoea allii TaxID=574096 RepID=UPI001F4E136A|nr:nucleotidyltransferase domain-containing protein [Pantoea allii]MCH9298305.1 nucleotidyltransferase domain-containing protein [Pantoea allii]
MMSLDPDGYIPTLATADVQPAFQAVVNAAVARLSADYRDGLHSIYLYGSVACGNAVKCRSDLDLCLLFSHPLRQEQQDRLSALKQALAEEHPVVSKVDFDIGTVNEALAPENRLSWGYWLKHHCRCLYGLDLSVYFERFRPSRALARAINGDVAAVLSGYATLLSRASQAREQQQYQRAAARKLIRSTNMLRTDNDIDWPRSLEDHVVRFVALYPEREDAITFFLAESKTPQATVAEFTSRLNDFSRWLLQQLG